MDQFMNGGPWASDMPATPNILGDHPLAAQGGQGYKLGVQPGQLDPHEGQPRLNSAGIVKQHVQPQDILGGATAGDWVHQLSPKATSQPMMPQAFDPSNPNANQWHGMPALQQMLQTPV